MNRRWLEGLIWLWMAGGLAAYLIQFRGLVVAALQTLGLTP